MIDVRIQSADFDPGKQIERLAVAHAAAVASLTIFANPDSEMSEMLVDHYPAMAKEELARIADEAAERWPLLAILVLHRHGRLSKGDRLAFVAAAASDRVIALEACDFLAREAMRRAPFWRREVQMEEEGAAQDRKG